MSARDTAYEVQGYAGGEWQTLQTCDRSEDAVAAAMKARRGRKYLSVRVNAEMYDGAAGKFYSRVIYRYSSLAEDQAAVQRQTRRSAPLRVAKPPVCQPETAEMSESLGQMVLWRLGLVALLGLAMLGAIRHLI